jgi:hypothetical protein
MNITRKDDTWSGFRITDGCRGSTIGLYIGYHRRIQLKIRVQLAEDSYKDILWD